ncbi:MAG: hypothetical protein QOK39_1076 [Acidimicrobiaceae bacterium]|nr:hypothetical protein [Acidimicrobiaceae bacterium]
MPHRLKPGGKYWLVSVVQGRLVACNLSVAKPHNASLEAKSSKL